MMKCGALAVAVIGFAFVDVGAALSAPGDAIASANQRSLRAEGSFRRCGRQAQGQAVIACMTSALSDYAASVNSCSHIRQAAPQAPPTVSAAAQRFSAAGSKAAAASVLNRTSAILRGLAAQSGGEAKQVYNRLDRAFQTALAVINSRS